LISWAGALRVDTLLSLSLLLTLPTRLSCGDSGGEQEEDGDDKGDGVREGEEEEVEGGDCGASTDEVTLLPRRNVAVIYITTAGTA
jgi:hypothetical protein